MAISVHNSLSHTVAPGTIAVNTSSKMVGRWNLGILCSWGLLSQPFDHCYCCKFSSLSISVTSSLMCWMVPFSSTERYIILPLRGFDMCICNLTAASSLPLSNSLISIPASHTTHSCFVNHRQLSLTWTCPGTPTSIVFTCTVTDCLTAKFSSSSMRTSVDASGSIRLLFSSNLNFFDDGPTLDLLAATMLHQVIWATVTSVVAEVKPSAWSFRITEFFQQKYFILVFLAYYLLVTLCFTFLTCLHIHCKHPAITDELTTTSLSPRDEELWVTIFDWWWFSDTTMDCHALLWSRYFTDFISSALFFGNHSEYDCMQHSDFSVVRLSFIYPLHQTSS